MPEELLGLFTKVPAAGSVKTRLLEAVAPRECLELYRAMFLDSVDQVLSAASHRGADRILFVTARSDGPLEGLPREHPLPLKPQEGRDLGERLANAFQWGFGNGYRRIVIAGADIPALGERRLCQALESLRTSRAVVGPVSDGGYYLIGLSASWPELFIDIPWGTSRVLEETLARSDGQRSAIRLLGMLHDLDRPEDLARFARNMACGKPDASYGCGPRLAALLRTARNPDAEGRG